MRTIIFILILYSCSCYHAKPLHEEAPTIKWEAWLLVDNQNEYEQSTEEILRRRITPKSIFIAPKFNPESLTPCSKGYSSNRLGRCVKLIKLDKVAQYNFLVEQLKEKFSPLDYDDEYYEEDNITKGPLHVNIPLDISSSEIDDSIENPDIAVIVAQKKTEHNILTRSLWSALRSDKHSTSSSGLVLFSLRLRCWLLSN